jgi:hypothetical protein
MNGTEANAIAGPTQVAFPSCRCPKTQPAPGRTSKHQFELGNCPMTNDRDPLRKSSDKKTSPMNNNVVWFLLVLGVLTPLTVTMMTGGPDEKVLTSLSN